MTKVYGLASVARGDYKWIMRAAGILLGLTCAAMVSRADLPMLSPALPIQDGGAPMTVGTVAAPCVVDWNQDGRKDLLIADSSCGQVLIFLNQGTDGDPQFSGGTPVESDGQPIVTSYG